MHSATLLITYISALAWWAWIMVMVYGYIAHQWQFYKLEQIKLWKYISFLFFFSRQTDRTPSFSLSSVQMIVNTEQQISFRRVNEMTEGHLFKLHQASHWNRGENCVHSNFMFCQFYLLEVEPMNTFDHQIINWPVRERWLFSFPQRQEADVSRCL